MASHKQSPRLSAFNAIAAMASTSETSLEKPRKSSFDSGRTTGAFKPLVRRITPNSVVFCHKELPVFGNGVVEAGESSRGVAAQSEEDSSHGCNSVDGDGDGDSSGDNMEDDGDEFNVVVHEYDGQVSPLRALSQVAHMKRKQDYLDDDYDDQKWSGVASPLSLQVEDAMVHVNVQEPVKNSVEDERSPVLEALRNRVQDGPLQKSKKFKQVQFQLEPPVYEKLMSLLVEQHDGSFERFVISAINANVVSGKSERKNTNMIRKPALTKWKRTRFDQLKGTETQDLAVAYKSLAESTPGAEVLLELVNTPWQELNMAQLQKMLEETKKMLLLNEKVYTCPHSNCGRRFSTPGNLRDHLNEHSGEQPYSCTFEDCPYRFTSKQLLCRHMKKHERAHKCTFEGCNKRFAFKERLIVHQKIHSDERPLSCPWEGCGKTFKWANSLHGHMRTHTGEKPFQCTFPGCGRLFGYKVDLTRHRRTHFGQPARSSH